MNSLPDITEQANKHHVYPLSLWWPDIPENILVMPQSLHIELHKTQNVDTRYVRKYRAKINHLLKYNRYYASAEEDLMNRYFEWASIDVEWQAHTLARIIQYYKRMISKWAEIEDWRLDELINSLIKTKLDVANALF